MIVSYLIDRTRLVFDDETWKLYATKFLHKDFRILTVNGYLARTLIGSLKNKLRYGEVQFFHRLVMRPQIAEKGSEGHLYEVHHKNKDKLDNRKANLELLKQEDHRQLHANEKQSKAFRTWYSKVYGEANEFMWEAYPEFQEWLDEKMEERYG